jgi:uncharacterized cupin superfamily protein
MPTVVPEARLKSTEGGLAPEGDGWFVVNAREAKWLDGEFGAYTRFEGDKRFPQLGLNIGVLAPGQPACMYHGEDEQEDFLVLAGECTLIIEGEERRLQPWDFVHCPPRTAHTIVAAGDRPSLLFAVGARNEKGSARYRSIQWRSVTEPGYPTGQRPRRRPTHHSANLRGAKRLTSSTPVATTSCRFDRLGTDSRLHARP